ncbi:MAG TPA: DUF3887 domain-containing protein [Bellilinea sp.]|nr:DUF3887 domain-containing protein [Bellilinea sp.]
MKIMRLLILTVLLVNLAACAVFSPTVEKPQVTDPAKEAEILKYAQPKAEALIAALFGGTYADFSKDLSPEMKSAMDEAAYTDLQTQLNEKVGEYKSAELETVLEQDAYAVLVYALNFSSGSKVAMRVVVNNTEPHQVSGLWFDSPELRK